MSHFERVANLFRSSAENHNLSAVKTSLFPLAHPLDRRHSSATSSEDGGDVHHDMDDSDPTRASARPRLAGLVDVQRAQSPRRKRRHRPFSLAWHSKEAKAGPAMLDCVMESPPVVFHGSPEDSTGALVSGQLVLEVLDERLEVDNLQASIVVRVVQKRPFQGHCAECGVREEPLKEWGFLRQPVTLMKGIHKFPFTELLDGSNPASIDTPAVSITYHLRAEAIVARQPFTAGTSVTPIRLERPLPVRRSLTESDAPHHSIRVFPPTDIRASAHYNQVLHATGKNTATVSLDGLAARVKDEDAVDCWRLKKASWRLEENVRTVATACERHADTSEGGEERSKAVRTEMRILGEQSIPPTWKAEYTADSGHVDLEFDFSIHQRHQLSTHPRYACDVSTTADSRARAEVSVTHSLMLELVVSRARATLSQPDSASETGMGRILRMRFRVFLSETGSGVAWDDEAPPLYEDVPPSPPGYADGNVAGPRRSEEAGEQEIYAARNSADGARSIADGR